MCNMYVLITLKSIYIGGCTLKINLVCIYNFYSSKVLATVYDIHTYVKQKVVFSFDNVLANPVEKLL